MGCAISRLDSNGLAKIRPVFPQDTDVRKHKRHLKNYNCTPSNKELLLHGVKGAYYDKSSSEEDNVHKAQHKDIKDQIISSSGKGQNGQKESKTINEDVEIFSNAEEDNVADGDERMTGHDNDGAFPGSPSFRLYCENTDAGSNHNAFKNAVSSKKKKSFKNVLPRGSQAAVKNLLSGKSCYSSPRSVHPHHSLHPHLIVQNT